MSNVLPSQSSQSQLYQIDFAAVAAGKRIASTKRRIRWRFGFANPEALANGLTGTACRGEEHDITVVWSVTSGKRLILADGHEVHYSVSRSGIIDFSWTMRGNHVMKVIAHASPPLAPTPGFRQYDFYVDGQSFFTFPKVFRLGLAANDPRGFAKSINVGGTGSGRSYSSNLEAPASGSMRRRNSSTIATLEVEAPHNADEEEAYLREAIKNSLVETDKRALSSGASVVSAPPAMSQHDLLLDFSEPTPALPPPTPFQSNAFASTSSAATSNALVPVQSQSAASNYGFDPNAYGSNQTQANPFSFEAAAITSNGYGPSSAQVGYPSYNAQAPEYGVQAPASSFGALVPASSQGAPASSFGYGQSQYGEPAPTPAYEYGATAQYGAAAPASSVVAPAQSAVFASLDPYASQQSSATPFGSPTPQTAYFSSPQPQQTPSTLGFASPPYFTSPAPQTPAVAPIPYTVPAVSQSFGSVDYRTQSQGDSAFSAPAPATEAPAFSMYSYSGTESQTQQQQSNQPAGNPADQMYSKFANMNHFELVSKSDAERSNPFEVYNTVGPQLSLSEMKSMSNKDGHKKEIMRTPVPAPTGGELVVASQQWGSQFAVGQPPNYGSAPQPAYGTAYGYGYGASSQPNESQGYGQQAQYNQQAAYGQPQQQPSYYQQPQQIPQFTQQPQYGQNTYGQNQTPQQGYY